MGILNSKKLYFYGYDGEMRGTSNLNIPNAHFIHHNDGGIKNAVNGTYNYADTVSNMFNYPNGTLCIYDNNGIGMFLTVGSTSWGTNSDRRIKRDIVSIDKSLSKLLKLNPVHYNYIKDLPGYAPREGFIAQEVEEFFPSVISSVDYDENLKDFIKSINIIELIPYIVKSIQEQNEIVVSQQTQITELKTIVESQQTQIDELKYLVQSLLAK